MNERFEELAEQAMVHVPGRTGLHTREFSTEKFAELIVRECANRVDWILAEGGKTQGDLIREHFGIKNEQSN